MFFKDQLKDGVNLRIGYDLVPVQSTNLLSYKDLEEDSQQVSIKDKKKVSFGSYNIQHLENEVNT